MCSSGAPVCGNGLVWSCSESCCLLTGVAGCVVGGGCQTSGSCVPSSSGVVSSSSGVVSSSSSGECIPTCDVDDNVVMPPGFVAYCPQGMGTAAYCFGGTVYCVDTETSDAYPAIARCGACPTCETNNVLAVRNAYISLCPAQLGNAFPYCYAQSLYCINIDNSMVTPNAGFCTYGIGQCPTCNAAGDLVVPPRYQASCSQSGFVPTCNAGIPGCFNPTTLQFSSYTSSCLRIPGE